MSVFYLVFWSIVLILTGLVKLVHKDRQLDFVGWFTLLPSSGPVNAILPTHRFFLSNYNESAIFLAFHPEAVLNHSAGGQLPLTVYESNWEVETEKLGEDKTMDDGSGGDGDSGENGLKLRFRELTYSVETEETEMIGMNYVATGGGSATATAGKEEKPSRVVESNGQGKRRLVEAEQQESTEASEVNDEDALTKEEEEMVATLTTKSNAIKMLQSRIDLITKYLESLPPAFINSEKSEDENMDADSTTPSLPVLRQIQALISRLDLIIPSDKAAFEKEMLQEANDVNLVDFLNTVMQSADQAREVGKKFGLVEQAKHQKRLKEQGHQYGSMGMGSMMNV